MQSHTEETIRVFVMVVHLVITLAGVTCFFYYASEQDVSMSFVWLTWIGLCLWWTKQ
jgi:hypothetical protein